MMSQEASSPENRVKVTLRDDAVFCPTVVTALNQGIAAARAEASRNGATNDDITRAFYDGLGEGWKDLHGCAWDDPKGIGVVADMASFSQVIDDGDLSRVRYEGNWWSLSDLDKTYRRRATQSNCDGDPWPFGCGPQASLRVPFYGNTVTMGFRGPLWDPDLTLAELAPTLDVWITNGDGATVWPSGGQPHKLSATCADLFDSCRFTISGLTRGGYVFNARINDDSEYGGTFAFDYLEVRNPLASGAGAHTIFSGSQFLAQDYTRSTSVSIPDGAQAATVHVGPVGSRAETTLLAADGTVIGPESVDPSVEYSRTESDEFYTIDNPMPGDWTIRIFGADIPPEGEWVQVQVDVTFPEDTTPPTTTATLDGDQAPNGWYTSDVTVNFAATDDFSGVAQTEFSVDGGESWAVAGGPAVFDQPGKNELLARSIDFAGNTEEPVVVSFSIGRPTELTHIGPFSAQYSDPVTLETMLVDLTDGSPVAGEPVRMMLGTQGVSPDPITDAAGAVFGTLVLDQPSGTQSLTSSYDGDGVRMASEDTDDFTILKETIVPEYSGDQIVPVTEDSLALRAVVVEEQDGSLGELSRATVEFAIYRMQDDSLVATHGPIGVVPVDGIPGVGIAETPAPNLAEGEYYVIVRPDAANGYYGGPQAAPATLTVYEPTGSFVTGGGRVDLDDGSHGTFSLNVRYNRNLTNIRGRSVYIYRQDGLDYFVKSNRLDGLAILGGGTALLQGGATLKSIDPVTGEETDLGGNYSFIVEVVDNGEPGSKDTYHITVRDRDGILHHEVTTRTIAGGNILLHD